MLNWLTSLFDNTTGCAKTQPKFRIPTKHDTDENSYQLHDISPPSQSSPADTQYHDTISANFIESQRAKQIALAKAFEDAGFKVPKKYLDDNETDE